MYNFEKNELFPTRNSRDRIFRLEGLALNPYQKQKSSWKMEKKNFSHSKTRANRCNKIFVGTNGQNPEENGTFLSKHRLKDWK